MQAKPLRAETAAVSSAVSAALELLLRAVSMPASLWMDGKQVVSAPPPA
jgi:hypothetical protein